MKKKDILVLAFGVAAFPPIWAVLAGKIGVAIAPVALVVAAIYVAANGNTALGIRQSLSYALSVVWTLIALKMVGGLPFPQPVNLYITLFIMGGLAVLIAGFLPQIFDLAALLGGWAIGLTIFTTIGDPGSLALPIQLLIAELVGVWYVGWGLLWFLGKFGSKE